MPRIARIVAEGFPHHITQRGTNRSEIFLDEKDRTFFLSILNQHAEKTGARVWAYCLMSNHFHLLLEPVDVEGLGKFLHGATFRYAQYFNGKYGRTGRLWENRYFSCPVDRDTYLWTAVRYIEKNPVRAKIVRRAEDWKWSSARAHVTGTADQAVNLFAWLPKYEWTNYAAFLKEDENNAHIRKATSTGRPFGNFDFLQMLESRLGRLFRPQKRGRPKKIGGCP